MDDLSAFRPSNLLHTQEKMSRYCPGGFHPVTLGDKFKNGRYTVRHKLGWGGFSTVWLAKDKELQKWVALKITTANSGDNSQESHIQKALQRKGTSKYIVRLLDSFTHVGPNGSHLCHVNELLGPSIDHVANMYRAAGKCFKPQTVLRLSKQLLRATASIHEAGYAHGDISGTNIAFTTHNLASSNDGIFRYLGFPKPEKLVRLDGRPLEPSLPKELVKRIECTTLWADEDLEDLRLLDWGQAFVQGHEPAKLAQPRGLWPPETIFTKELDFRVDLWRAGATIYTLVFGERPFICPGDLYIHMIHLIDFIEDLPDEWTPVWERVKKDAGATRKRRPKKKFKESRLERDFNRRIHDPSLQPLLPVMTGLMRFKPDDRLSAREALYLLDGSSTTTVLSGHI